MWSGKYVVTLIFESIRDQEERIQKLEVLEEAVRHLAEAALPSGSKEYQKLMETVSSVREKRGTPRVLAQYDELIRRLKEDEASQTDPC